MFSSRRRRLSAGLLLLPLLVAACGDDSSSSPDTTASGGAGGAGEVSSLEELIAAAEEEGALTVYSEQAEVQLNALVDAFMEEYPAIEVTVVRDIHQNLAPPTEVELNTGQGIGDIFITVDHRWFKTQSDAGSFLPVQGPELTGEGTYDADAFVREGDHFEVGGAMNVYAWNTKEWPDGMTGDHSELLDPELAGGRIGLVEPTVGAYVDWYLWLEDQMGEGFLEDLAAQKPRIYQGAAPINEAVVAGEVAVTPYAFPPFVIPSQDAGAPIDMATPPAGIWGAKHLAGVLKTAPHPNAAWLFANFLVQEPAQKIVNGQQSAVVEGAGLGYNEDIAAPRELTPDDITDFQERFRSLFQG